MEAGAEPATLDEDVRRMSSSLPEGSSSSSRQSVSPSVEPSTGASRTSHSDRAGGRRATRACLQCRQRKQKCAGPSQVPCKRCAECYRSCSFEQDIQGGELRVCLVGERDEIVQPYSTDPLIVALQSELARTVARVETLETLLGSSATSQASAPDLVVSPPSPQPPRDELAQAQAMRALMDAGAGSAHTSAVQSLALLSQQREEPRQSTPALEGRRHSQLTDPVKEGVLSMSEAQELLNMYAYLAFTFWDHCHPHAPLLCVRTQRQAHALAAEPFLFSSCIAVGARYANMHNPSRALAHSKYLRIVELLDHNISALVLRTTGPHVCLSTVQALLAYIQWTPLESPDANRTRFSDNGAFIMMGLAVRVAKLIELEARATSPFFGAAELITDEDMKHMRVWLNLVSNDHFIWLTTNFPATLDPTSSVRCARVFAAHPRAQLCDSRAAGLSEIVSIANKALQTSGKRSLAELDMFTVTRANEELDEWARVWRDVLAQTAGRSIVAGSMPVSSLWWYCLAINGPHANAFLAGERCDFTRSALSLSVDSAAELLFALSSEATATHMFRSPGLTSFSIDQEAFRCFLYSVDYHWVTHAFSAAFLALAYERGGVDPELGVVLQPMAKQEALPHTLLYRLLALGVKIFDDACAVSRNHPAGQYRAVLRAAFNSVCTPVERLDDVNAASQEFLHQLSLDGFTDFRDSISAFPATDFSAFPS